MVAPQDIFYFYNSSIGDLTELLRKYAMSKIDPRPGRIMNAYGVSIDPKFFPGILTGREGVDPLPIPANWHADIAEFGSALYAVDTAKNQFTVVELGCGWGCWLNITGAVAKRKGLNVRLIGVEGDEGHVQFALQSLRENGFACDEYVIHHGIAHAYEGVALFPVQQAGSNWGNEPLFSVDQETAERLVKNGSHQRIPQVPLRSLLPADRSHIDLLHIDIQGGEIPLIPDSLPFLGDKVAMILIGTHSREIEGQLFSCLSKAGWKLDVERPAILGLSPMIHTTVDGVQLWRNPKFVPHARGNIAVPRAGCVTVLHHPQRVSCNEEFFISVDIRNDSDKEWSSSGVHPVSLSYHWQGSDAAHCVFDGIRTKFKSEVLGSAQSARQTLLVKAPPKPGKCKLLVTVVQDGVRWFDNSEFRTCEIEVTIE
jgi:hypothetical protein